MKGSNSKWVIATMWLMLLITLSIVVFRSATLSMTHDESATWLYIHDRNILLSLFDSGAWGTANNHYLNSVLIHFFTSIFGDEEWVIRLPNTLAYVLYGISSISLIQRIYKRHGAQLLAASLIFGNVYLIDFFSQARGYGMSVAFHMTAILFLYEWIKNRQVKNLTFVFSFVGFATLSLFTHLIFIPVYTVIAYAIMWWHHKRKSISYTISELVIPWVSMIFLGALLFIPFTTLSGNAEFKWGTTMLEESFKGLINDGLQGRNYLGQETAGIIGVILILAIIIGIWTHFRANPKDQEKKIFHFSVLGIFLLMIIAMVASKWIIGTLYPVERKSTIYLPLTFILLPYSIEFIKNKAISFYLGLAISLLFVVHFADKLEMDRTREWYYDYQTKDYISSIVNNVNGEETVVGMHWTFYWSATYYIRNGGHHHVELFRYHNDQKKIKPADYMIINNKEFPQFKNEYEILEGPNRSMVSLLKRK